MRERADGGNTPRPPTPDNSTPLELWAGYECTLNRLGHRYVDQLEAHGHYERLSDLDLLLDIGAKAVRYPILWERTAPDGHDRADWLWPDERLERLRELGIRPIVGLVHHGSGPRWTSLLDESFAEGLAAYARAVAERYSWLDAYTPVNEPLTTARFSALYGHWYPHVEDGLSFARALLNQCRATVLAMRAIRSVNPSARLVQTEDLGKTFSTPTLDYQAEFENERRFLTFDLLTGRVGRGHPVWSYLLWLGVEERELDWFRENTCPPDIVGINHYVTSQRFLDERLERYPPSTHGGNHRQAYADVEAVRVLHEGPLEVEALLGEVWDRYGSPIAVTEAHLGCTREEQIRWMLEVWESAGRLRRRGADVRSVTAWALLGLTDWDSLVTATRGRYEPGVFDLRAPRPRPTAVARLLRDLSYGRTHDHPVLDSPGWWRRDDRLLYPPVHRDTGRDARRHRPAGSEHVGARSRTAKATPRAIAIVGEEHKLGRALAGAAWERGLAHRLFSRGAIERESSRRSDPSSLASTLDDLLASHNAWAVVDVSALAEQERADEIAEPQDDGLIEWSAALARVCERRGTALVHFSSDLVFEGGRASEAGCVRPNREGDRPEVYSARARLLAEAEICALGAHTSALVARVGPLFGPPVAGEIPLPLLRTPEHLATTGSWDDVVSPSYVPDVVGAALDLLVDREAGVFHLANHGETTWAALVERVVDELRLDRRLVEARPLVRRVVDHPFRRRRVLARERAWPMPSLDDAVSRFVEACRACLSSSLHLRERSRAIGA